MGKINIAFDHIREVEKIHELSVVLYTDSFFYGLWSDNEQLLKSDSHEIENLPQLLKVWQRNYDLSMVRIMSTMKPYVHIDEEDFKEKHFKKYFKGLYPTWKLKAKKPEKDSLVREKINTLHYLDPELLDEMKGKDFPSRISHISTALANYAYLVNEEIVSHISEDALHIVCRKDDSFHFYNQFYCETAEDYLYYYLLVLNGFGLDPHDTTICVGGNIMTGSKLHTLLQGYFKELNIVDDSLKVQTTENPKHLFYDLYLCKSCV